MGKKFLIKLKIPSQEATTREPVGPTLGQCGVPIMDFCKKFNSSSSIFEKGSILNVIIYGRTGKEYDFIIKFPDIFILYSICLNITSGISRPGFFSRYNFYYVTCYFVYEILNYLYNNTTENFGTFFQSYKKLFHSMRSFGFFCIK